VKLRQAMLTVSARAGNVYCCVSVLTVSCVPMVLGKMIENLF